MKRLALALVFACSLGCAPAAETVTVTEVPPQELPSPQPQATGQPTQSTPSTVLAVEARVHEEWIGTYMCAQGQTDLALHLDRAGDGSIDGVFEFSHAPSGAGGSYKLRGSVDSNGNVRLVPGPWLDRPRGYVSVGMRGGVHGDTFTGRIDNATCGEFALRRR